MDVFFQAAQGDLWLQDSHVKFWCGISVSSLSGGGQGGNHLKTSTRAHVTDSPESLRAGSSVVKEGHGVLLQRPPFLFPHWMPHSELNGTLLFHLL